MFQVLKAELERAKVSVRARCGRVTAAILRCVVPKLTFSTWFARAYERTILAKSKQTDRECIVGLEDGNHGIAHHVESENFRCLFLQFFADFWVFRLFK